MSGSAGDKELGHSVDVRICGNVFRHRKPTRRSGCVRLREGLPPVSTKSPSKRVRLDVVPMGDECLNAFLKLGQRTERAVPEHPTGENAEPDLDLVYPRRVQRRVNEPEAVAMPLIEFLPTSTGVDVEIVPDNGDR